MQSDRAAVCVRRLDENELRGPVEILSTPSEAVDVTGLCVYDLTQMLLPDGTPISLRSRRYGACPAGAISARLGR